MFSFMLVSKVKEKQMCVGTFVSDMSNFVKLGDSF